jgi:hypothetical protein
MRARVLSSIAPAMGTICGEKEGYERESDIIIDMTGRSVKVLVKYMSKMIDSG